MYEIFIIEPCEILDEEETFKIQIDEGNIFMCVILLQIIYNAVKKCIVFSHHLQLKNSLFSILYSQLYNVLND